MVLGDSEDFRLNAGVFFKSLKYRMLNIYEKYKRDSHLNIDL